MSSSTRNEYVANLWMVETSGAEPRQFTEGGKDSAPHWSPDGERIAFVRAKDKSRPQIHTIGLLAYAERRRAIASVAASK